MLTRIFLTWLMLIGSTYSCVTGCNDAGGGFVAEVAPRIELSESGRPLISGATLSLNSSSPAVLKLRNVGDGALKIFQIGLLSSNSFEIITSPNPTRQSPIILPPASIHEFQISHVGPEKDAKLEIVTNQTLDGTSVFQLNLRVEDSIAKLIARPSLVDMGIVPIGTTAMLPVSLLNVGSGPLNVSKFFFSGRTEYSFEVDGTFYGVTAESANQGINLTTPLAIDSGLSKIINVSYDALYPDEARGEIIFVTDDESRTIVELIANVESPCLKISPSRVDFGGKHVGQQGSQDLRLENCGTQIVKVHNVEIESDPIGAYDLNLPILPLELPAGSYKTLTVFYSPTMVSLLDSSGAPIKDISNLKVSSNAFIPNYDVELTGYGVDGNCPTPVITVSQGDEVAPQALLNLSARNSTTSNGFINRWEWSVIQPQGSASIFIPTFSRQDVTFETNVVGEYIFRLKVWNSQGIESCSQAEKIVKVISDAAIRVELLWNTPGDRDQTDEGMYSNFQSVGTDVDLHFVRPTSMYEFFGFFDCHWLNPNPDWGSRGLIHDPALDRDDTDGAGPENLNMKQPENLEYRIGVHYWDDWGYGLSYATIKIYIYGQLREQWANVPLSMYDLWDAFVISWPSQQIIRMGNGVNPEIYQVF